MAHPRKDESRILAADELELVDKSHHPEVQDLSDAELSDLLRLIRDRRDKAQSAGNRQRREMRGKAEPKGSRASADNTGTRLKAEILAQAVRRINSERERRRKHAAKEDLIANAQAALARRQAAGKGRSGPASRTADKGMNANESARRKKTLPGAKVGSVSQQNKRAQAKRDS